MELYLLHHHARQRLAGEGLAVARTLVGNYTTSLEMAGASLTVTALDEEAKRAVGCAGAHDGAALVDPGFPCHRGWRHLHRRPVRGSGTRRRHR